MTFTNFDILQGSDQSLKGSSFESGYTIWIEDARYANCSQNMSNIKKLKANKILF